MNARTRGRLTETEGRINQLGRLSAGDSLRQQRVAPLPTHHDQPRASSRINDNYCVTKLQTQLLAGSPTPRQTLDIFSNVNLHVVHSVHTTPGHSQKRDLSPGSAGCYCRENKLKYVKSVSCVSQLCCVRPVTNVKNVASNLPVGARFQNFLQTWLDLVCRSECCSNPERGLHPPLSDPAKTHKVSHSH